LRAVNARLRPWHVLILAVALFGILRVLLPALGTLPRMLTAEEADTLLGAQLLCQSVAVPPGASVEASPSLPAASAEASPPLEERLKAGFETTATQPRLAGLGPDKTAQRAAIEAPVPRWLGALGIGVLPTPDSATNLERASSASALAVAVALALLVWGLRRHGLLVAGMAVALLLATPGVVDAALSAGHGASAVLVSVLFLVTLDRVLEQRAGFLGQLALGAVMGLALGIHPMALILYVVVLVAWAVRQAAPLEPPPAAAAATPGVLRLPSVPFLLLLLPVIALVVLVALWPALWSETGKRLGAWLLDAGSTKSPPHEVLGLVYDQASGRTAQAFTALLQWVAWTPLPVLGLWLVGLARALRLGRDGAWAPIVLLGAWLVVGALDGGLFGGRNSLLGLMWVPTAITAAQGVAATIAFLEARLARARSGPAARPLAPVAWLAGLSPVVRTGLVVALLLLAPVLQSVRGTTFGMARASGAELRAPLPLGLLKHLAATRPWSVLALEPQPEQRVPGLDAALDGLSLELRAGSRNDADLLLLTSSSSAPGDPGPTFAHEVARDPRPGLIVSLWERTAPGPLDKRPALPHN